MFHPPKLERLMRLDHVYFVFAPPGTPATHLHCGGTPYLAPFSYDVRDRQIISSLIVVSYALTPSLPGEGFACLPGSHKSAFECPADFVDQTDSSHIVVPAVEPGDALIFTEALTHNATAWSAPYTRRALLYKYMPFHMALVRPKWSQRLLDACTPEQRDLLVPAGG
jgi:ectoine hydroxylase-related dioxygenase (phytanoyl-CoA dioxygenase family)